MFEKAGWIRYTELRRYLDIAKGWCDICDIKDFIAKFTKKDAEWFVRPIAFNDIDFYKNNLHYPLIDHLFTLYMCYEFVESQKKNINDQKKILKEFGPFAKNRLKTEIYDWCKKNKIHLVQNNEIELMKLCPEFFKYPDPLNTKIPVDDMIELIKNDFITLEKEIPIPSNLKGGKNGSCIFCKNTWVYQNLSICCNCRMKYINYTVYDFDYNIIINQKYKEQDEIKVLNVLCKKIELNFREVKITFPNTCFKLDLSNFEEFNIFTPLLQIKCWTFIHYDTSPVYSGSKINDYKLISKFDKKDTNPFNEDIFVKQNILYSKEFLEYCYTHINETIPQELLLKFCGY